MLALLLVLSGLAACLHSPAPAPPQGVVQTPLAELPPAASPPPMDRIPLSSPPDPETPVTPPPVAPDPPAESLPPEVATPPAEPPATDTPPSAAAPNPEPAPEPPSEPDTETSTPPEVPESPAPSVEDPPTAAPAPAPAPAPLPVSYDEERAAYLRKFNAAIERHKQYPPQSRRMGRQGRVALLIGINAAGELERLEVASSSGHLALDNAALEAVRAAAPFPPPPQPAFDPHPLFQLGLEFRLQ